MDPESIQMLMQYLSSAKKGNKGVSSVAGNLDNPILLALAGVLDPYYGSGQTTSGAGNLYGSFASDKTTPAAVRAVMDYVDQGMNSYQIEAQINALDSDVIQNSGYTDEQLISMGREMAKEGGKKGTDVFAKAGLRNPNDIYGLGDVPLDASQSEDYQSYVDASKKSGKGRELADWRLAVARNNMSKYTEDGVEVPDWFPKGAAEGTVAQIGKGAKYNTARIGLDKNGKGPNLNTARIGLDADGKGPNLNTARIGEGAEYNTARIGPVPRKSNKKEGKRPSQDERDALSRAQAGVADVETQVAADLMRAQAVREGALRRASQSGRTPFTDQTSTLLKFIAGSK
jgi:hypothetical protein